MWLEDESGATGHALVGRVADGLDPGGILNPAVLLEPTDRLEE